ncbi:uncharacterized protein [Dermacentor andersoni]|uniref:uncharacterized protein isoform X2 n=1 Tax=Dermacentor andersoni TaxID=34620 RepID=UPI0024162FB3|nr:uncharacterized protein LOC126530661 [Dermacentor andersoni]
MDMSPHTPLKPHHYELRHKIMNLNGIHTIYPLGRDFANTFTGTFDAYEGLTVRVFGYTRDAGLPYEIAIGNGRAFCLMKFSQLKPLGATDGENKWSSDKNNHVYGPGTFYTFALRAITDSYYGESFQAIVEEEAVTHTTLLWKGASHWEIMQDGCMVHLSKHVGDEEGTTKFPTSTGLDPLLNHFVLMEVGTIAHYTGVYSGTSEVTVMAVGAVQDMGRPNHSGVTIRISIRKTLDTYIFFPDYGSEPVVAAFDDLVLTGHQYAPRFSKNFSVRQVHMEVFY